VDLIVTTASWEVIPTDGWCLWQRFDSSSISRSAICVRRTRTRQPEWRDSSAGHLTLKFRTKCLQLTPHFLRTCRAGNFQRDVRLPMSHMYNFGIVCRNEHENLFGVVAVCVCVCVCGVVVVVVVGGGFMPTTTPPNTVLVLTTSPKECF
jgi:hypothetical protein